MGAGGANPAPIGNGRQQGDDMKSKILGLFLSLFLLLTLVGCGQEATPTLAPTAVEDKEPATPTQVALEPTATTRLTDTPIPTPEPTATPEPTPTLEPVAVFEDARCPFELPPDQVEGETVECGYLAVPEDRADPDGATIRLSVAVFHPPGGATEPDPIIYLAGGPGGSALEFLFLAFDQIEPLLSADRDVILFDQRGVGYSEPALDCPNLIDLSRELLDYELDGEQLTDEQATDLVLEAIEACSQSLSAVADLEAYHTAENAADVRDLRRALGYEEVNLWGVSYGTRLALDVMRDYPEGVRTVVLDSVYPPDVDLYLGAPANADRAFNVFFDACAADERCSTAFPDLRVVFSETVDQLNQEPANIEVVNSLTGERYDTVLDGDDLMGLLFQLLYEADVIPSLPKLIYDASGGNYDLIALVYGALLAQQEVTSHGMYFSVQCHDEFAFNSLEQFETAVTDHSDLAQLFEDSMVGKLGFLVCEFWGAGQAEAIENEPVTSDIPTLILAGEYDPITPPAWGQQAAKTLENSYFFEYPGLGHAATLSGDCPREMMMAFVDDPAKAPDDVCLAAMGPPQWIVPTEGAAEVELEPFTSEAFGVTGVIPAGWNEVAPGVYSRGSSGLDVAAVIVQAAPTSSEFLLNLLTSQLGLEETLEVVAEREANDLTWSLYFAEVQGLSVDIALAEDGGLALIVVLQSEAGEHESLYESVFLPVVDALVPLP
jgi:pimeloyl-ACP methyl ester carboxylesterase